jgi:hypothetical protein
VILSSDTEEEVAEEERPMRRRRISLWAIGHHQRARLLPSHHPAL